MPLTQNRKIEHFRKATSSEAEIAHYVSAVKLYPYVKSCRYDSVGDEWIVTTEYSLGG